VHFAEVYLEAVDFVSISIALYGLIVFYVLCKDELKGRRPLNKVSATLGQSGGVEPNGQFLAIKLIVFFTFYQSELLHGSNSHELTYRLHVLDTAKLRRHQRFGPVDRR
jgi:hypothetical protein